MLRLGRIITDTQAASHIKGTPEEAGAAAEQAVILRGNTYRELTSKYFSIPVVVETHGLIIVDGANFLPEFGR